jgi:hypothetical protein
MMNGMLGGYQKTRMTVSILALCHLEYKGDCKENMSLFLTVSIVNGFYKIWIQVKK